MSEVTFFSFLILLVVNIIYFLKSTAECQLQLKPLTDKSGQPILDPQGNPIIKLVPIVNPVEGSGNAGTLEIIADTIQLEDRGSLTAISAGGNGGNINLNSDLLRFRNGGNISTTAGLQNTPGNGGNINIDSTFIVAYPSQNNDITANAFTGEGGNITIAAEGIFGIEKRPQDNVTNDIEASSKSSLDGTVSITILQPDAIRGTTELPRNVVQTQETTEQTCTVNQETGESNGLTVKGKGGVPPAPDLPLKSQAIMFNGKDVTTQTNQAQYPEIKPIPTSYGDIIPAQGVIVTEDGRVILTAYRTDGNSRVPQGSANCGK